MQGITRIFVPDDTCAVSVDADAIAEAIAAEVHNRDLNIDLVRNGSRGLCWLEPLVEIEIEGERHAFGRVTVADVADLFAQAFGPAHPKSLGPTESLSYLGKQTRITFARVGVIDPLSPKAYESHGGLVGLRQALTMSSGEIVKMVSDSGLRGRGGAAFPAGIKWRTVLEASGEVKYIACNADEGDSGTFSDRMLMEGDPFCLLEGMVIAGLAQERQTLAARQEELVVEHHEFSSAAPADSRPLPQATVTCTEVWWFKRVQGHAQDEQNASKRVRYRVPAASALEGGRYAGVDRRFRRVLP